MSVRAAPPVKLGDSERQLNATGANQTEERLSKFAYLLDRTSLANTSTSLPRVAQLFERVVGPATTSGEAIQPLKIVPLPSSTETPDNLIEGSRSWRGSLLTGDVHRQEPSRQSRGWKPKASLLAGFVVIGTVVALGSRDYVRGQAGIYGSLLLDAIAGLDDASNPRGNAISDERMAQLPSDATVSEFATPSTAGPPMVADNGQSARARADSSEEQAGNASAPAAPVSALAPAANAPADLAATQSGFGDSNVTHVATTVETPLAPGPAVASSNAGPPIVPDSTQPARVGVVDKQAVDTSAPAALVSATTPTASTPPAVGATESAVGVPNVTPTATTVETPAAPGPAVASLHVASQISEPKPVRIVSVRPDGTPISSAGSAGTAQASNPGSDLWEKPGGLSSAGVTATLKVATEMPSQSQKPAKHQKREKPEKSARALNAAEAAASSPPPTSAEPSAAEQGSATPLQGAHAGRL